MKELIEIINQIMDRISNETNISKEDISIIFCDNIVYINVLCFSKFKSTHDFIVSEPLQQLILPQSDIESKNKLDFHITNFIDMINKEFNKVSTTKSDTETEAMTRCMLEENKNRMMEQFEPIPEENEIKPVIGASDIMYEKDGKVFVRKGDVK